MVELEKVLAEASKNNRICPQPQKWNELYQLLPNKRRTGNGHEPSSPLILAAWWETSAMQKMIRLRDHIEYASEQGCLDIIHAFLVKLKEDDWYHIGD